MPPASNYVLVKAKLTLRERLTPSVETQKKIAHGYAKVSPWIGFSIGLLVAILVVVDTLVNNWAIIDFCGNGAQFRTPVAHIHSALDLPQVYTFGKRLHLQNLSHVAMWMTDFSVSKIAGNSEDIYLLTGGTYTIMGTMNYCNSFANTYAVDISRPIKLATSDDAMTFLRGDGLSHAFTNDLTEQLPSSGISIDKLQDLGFTPARIQIDLRMTTEFRVDNSTKTQTFLVSMYRIYTKAYCTGCKPIAELGRGMCNLTMVYNDTTSTLQVKTATSIMGSKYDAGYMFQRTIYSTIASFLKFAAIFIALGGYLASRKTVQWQESCDEKVETVWASLLKTIAPKFFPHMSHALRFDLFCYNSDIFVILLVISTLLDMSQALMFIREVNTFNMLSPNSFVSLQLFAISSRMLWLNVGLVKFAKFLLQLIFPSSYSGESRFMEYLNFSNVTMLYLSAIMLYYVPPFIEYNNKGRFDIHNYSERLDGHFVNYFNSFYFRCAPAVAIGLICNVACFLAFDHALMVLLWRALKRNSLARQAIYNSTSIICEYIDDVKLFDGNIIIHVKARRLSTLQWYFMYHMFCFGLPEREMSKKKTASAPKTTKDEHSDNNSLYVVGQSDSGHFHLFDEHLSDVKGLAFNIKILRDSVVLVK